MKKKFKNKKGITLAVAGLAALSIITVGFSSWVISASVNNVSQNVTVSVGDVEDNSVTLAIVNDYNTEALDKDLKVAFDDDGVAVPGNPVQPKTSDTSNEDMVFSFQFTMTAGNASAFSNIDYAIISIASTNLYALTNANVIVSPISIDSSGNGSVKIWDSSIDNDSTSATGLNVSVVETSATVKTVTITYTFKWGSAVGGDNPTQMNSETFNSTGKNAMALLDAANSTKIPTIEITVKPVLKAQ